MKKAIAVLVVSLFSCGGELVTGLWPVKLTKTITSGCASAPATDEQTLDFGTDGVMKPLKGDTTAVCTTTQQSKIIEVKCTRTTGIFPTTTLRLESVQISGRPGLKGSMLSSGAQDAECPAVSYSVESL